MSNTCYSHSVNTMRIWEAALRPGYSGPINTVIEYDADRHTGRIVETGLIKEYLSIISLDIPLRERAKYELFEYLDTINAYYIPTYLASYTSSEYEMRALYVIPEYHRSNEELFMKSFVRRLLSLQKDHEQATYRDSTIHTLPIIISVVCYYLTNYIKNSTDSEKVFDFLKSLKIREAAHVSKVLRSVFDDDYTSYKSLMSDENSLRALLECTALIYTERHVLIIRELLKVMECERLFDIVHCPMKGYTTGSALLVEQTVISECPKRPSNYNTTLLFLAARERLDYIIRREFDNV